MDCAIKLIFTIDLTVDVVERVGIEAEMLSSIKNRNVVKIHGVSVLPPRYCIKPTRSRYVLLITAVCVVFCSVCILLELCAFGSLGDILRGTSSVLPMDLHFADQIFLALGAARGVLAVHQWYLTHWLNCISSYLYIFICISQLIFRIII